jgi:hypothetical protein
MRWWIGTRRSGRGHFRARAGADHGSLSVRRSRRGRAGAQGARAASPRRPPHARLLRPRLARGRAHVSGQAGGDGGVHALDPGRRDRGGARRGPLRGDAASGRSTDLPRLAAPLAGGSVHRAKTDHVRNAADRARPLQAARGRLRARGPGRGDRLRSLREGFSGPWRVAPSDRHTRRYAHRDAGRGGRRALGDAELGVAAVAGQGRLAASATRKPAMRDHPGAACILHVATRTHNARKRWRWTAPGAS